MKPVGKNVERKRYDAHIYPRDVYWAQMKMMDPQHEMTLNVPVMEENFVAWLWLAVPLVHLNSFDAGYDCLPLEWHIYPLVVAVPLLPRSHLP